MEKKNCSSKEYASGVFNATSKTKLPPCIEEEEGEYDIAQHRDKVHGLGTAGALSHMIKGSMGSGILSIPLAFKNGGLWVGLGGAIFIGFLCTHCVQLLVVCSHENARRLRRPALGFAATTEAAFLTGPSALRKHAATAREVVNISLLVAYYLGLTVYVVFIAASLKQVADDSLNINLNIRIYCLMLLVILVPIGSIHNLRYLVPFSAVAIMFLMFGCGVVLYEVFLDLPPLDSRPAFSSWDRIALFYATMCFAIEGIGTVMPIENSMKYPRHFLGCPGVLNVAMAWLVLMYTLVGFFGYLRYGEDTEGSITLNLGHNLLGQTVKMLVALNVVCSYGLISCVPAESVWRFLEPRSSEQHKNRNYYIMRVLLVVGTVLLATALPDLEPAIGLVGTICYSTLGLFFPPVLEMVTFWQDPRRLGRWRWRLYKDGLLVLAWFVCLIAGLQASIAKIIQLYLP